MTSCVDEGLIQAYLDGELPTGSAKAVASHLAACKACAARADEAAQEIALFTQAATPALNFGVPTERLRARLYEAIAELETPAPRAVQSPSFAERLRAAFASFSASLTAFTPRQAAAFAGLTVAAVLVGMMVLFQEKPEPQHLAKNGERPSSVPAAINTEEVDNGTSSPNSSTSGGQTTLIDGLKHKPVQNVRGNKATVEQARRTTQPVMKATGENTKSETEAASSSTQANNLLPGEKAYIEAIASLSTAIEGQGAGALPPTLRAEYERNLAVVDQAIVASRVAAKRDPRDADAQEFLRTAYQSKVDLLNTVAEQSQLATLRR